MSEFALSIIALGFSIAALIMEIIIFIRRD